MSRTVLFAASGLLTLLALVVASDGRGSRQAVTGDALAPAPEPAAAAARAPATLRAGSFDWVENRGQWPEPIVFAGRLGQMTVAAERGSLQLGVRPDGDSGASVRLVFEGAASDATTVGEEARPGIYSFFVGNDPSRWVRGLRTFGAVRYKGLYPGIDLLVYAGSSGIKYDLELAPGADLALVRIRCEGAQDLRLDQDGSLVLETAAGPLVQGVGRCWEVDGAGEKHDVIGSHRLIDDSTVGFHIDGRDPARALVIDPGLVWSTYLGGAGNGVGDTGNAVAFDRDGNVTVVGTMDGTSFPMTPGAYQHPGPSTNSQMDIFVTRLRASDGALIYSCVIGGSSQEDRARAVAVDGQRRAVVAGRTNSMDFPTTPNAFERVNDAGGCAFVLRLSPTGSDLEYSTFIEGTGTFGGSEAYALRVDMRTGAAIVGGMTGNPTFPVTPGAFDTTVNAGEDGFLARLDPSGSFLEWATYFGGSGGDWIHALDVDEQGRVVCTGDTYSTDLPVTPDAFDPVYGPQSYRNAYVARFDPSGSALEYSSYFGGAGPGSSTYGYGIAFEPSGGVILAGDTSPVGFPTTPGALQTDTATGTGYLARLSPAGTLSYSTYYGGAAAGTFIRGLAVDASGIATFVGHTSNGQQQTTPGAWQPPTQGAASFIARLDPRGARLLYGTSFGPYTSGGQACAIAPAGRAAVCGSTRPVFPTTPGSASPNYNGGQTDAFIVTIDLFLQGAEPFGASTASCRGPLLLNATMMPAPGTPDFSLYLSGAPPLSSGLLIFGTAAATPTTALGVDIWLDRHRPIRRIPVVTDADGYLDHPIPIPLATSGRRISAQALIRNTPQCAGTGAWSASNGLTITVQ